MPFGEEEIKGVDIFDLDDEGRIATFTVMLPPMARIRALADAMAVARTPRRAT
ncbi:MAG: hypothetical protein ACR2JC_17545 [Chloroflexota bacterium]